MTRLQSKLAKWWKNKKLKTDDEAEVYVYMNWEFMKNTSIDHSEPGDISLNSKFENIHSWLKAQEEEEEHTSLCSENCGCENSEDSHYACTDIRRLYCDNNLYDEELYYSWQIRKQSSTLFRS